MKPAQPEIISKHPENDVEFLQGLVSNTHTHRIEILNESGRLQMGRVLTGRSVFYWFLGFFLLVFTVNAFMIWLAFTSWTGVETHSTYNYSQNYQNRLDAAKAQEDLGWSVEVETDRDEFGTVKVSVSAKDKSGNALSGYSAVVKFERPTRTIEDKTVILSEFGSGAYRGDAKEIAFGQWNLVIEFFKEKERVFRSRNRVYFSSKSETES